STWKKASPILVRLCFLPLAYLALSCLPLRHLQERSCLRPRLRPPRQIGRSLPHQHPVPCSSPPTVVAAALIVLQPVSKSRFIRTNLLDRGWSSRFWKSLTANVVQPSPPLQTPSPSRVPPRNARLRHFTTQRFLTSPVPQSRLSEPASQLAACPIYLSISALRAF